VAEAQAFFAERIEAAVNAGSRRDRILIDPGFGFGKTVQQNLDPEAPWRTPRARASDRHRYFPQGRSAACSAGCPWRSGWRTAATVAVAIMHGAEIVRVHDVRAIVGVARLTDAIVRDA
jgi:dihydropteroate synthase